MEAISWMSVLLYCGFTNFLFYQQLHLSSFKGSSKAFQIILGVSISLGMLIGLIYLGYYGWSVTWWAPLLVFIIGIVSVIAGIMVEFVIGKYVLSLLGFIAWPICAYFMIKCIPNQILL